MPTINSRFLNLPASQHKQVRKQWNIFKIIGGHSINLNFYSHKNTFEKWGKNKIICISTKPQRLSQPEHKKRNFNWYICKNSGEKILVLDPMSYYLKVSMLKFSGFKKVDDHSNTSASPFFSSSLLKWFCSIHSFSFLLLYQTFCHHSILFASGFHALITSWCF